MEEIPEEEMEDVSRSQRLDRYQTEINARIRVMTIIMWVINFIGTLIIVCCIVSWIVVSVDIKKDRTLEVTLAEITDDDGGGDGGDGGEDGSPIPPDTQCNDNNNCTIDFERLLGGCEYLRQKTNTQCQTPCFTETLEDPLTCQVVEVQKGVEVPKCMGTREQCRGSCVTAGDCPTGPTVQNSTGNSSVITAECVGGSCLYSWTPVNGMQFGEELPIETCVNDTSREIQVAVCNATIVSAPDYFFSCMTVEFICEEQELFDDPDPPDSPTQLIPICQYYFWCSIPCVGVHIGTEIAKRSSMPTKRNIDNYNTAKRRKDNFNNAKRTQQDVVPLKSPTSDKRPLFRTPTSSPFDRQTNMKHKPIIPSNIKMPPKL